MRPRSHHPLRRSLRISLLALAVPTLVAKPHRPRFWAMALLTMSNNDVWRKYLNIKG